MSDLVPPYSSALLQSILTLQSASPYSQHWNTQETVSELCSKPSKAPSSLRVKVGVPAGGTMCSWSSISLRALPSPLTLFPSLWPQCSLETPSTPTCYPLYWDILAQDTHMGFHTPPYSSALLSTAQFSGHLFKLWQQLLPHVHAC